MNLNSGRNLSPLNRFLAPDSNPFLWLGKNQMWSSPQKVTEYSRLLGLGDHERRLTLNLSPRSLWTISSSSLAVLLQNWEKSLIQRSLSLACSEQMYFRVMFTHACACTCLLSATLTQEVAYDPKAPAIRETPLHVSD